MSTTTIETIRADDINVGDQVAAADGYLFEVRAFVKETAQTITFQIGSDFSPDRGTREGKLWTARKSSRFQVVRGGAVEINAKREALAMAVWEKVSL